MNKKDQISQTLQPGPLPSTKPQPPMPTNANTSGFTNEKRNKAADFTRARTNSQSNRNRKVQWLPVQSQKSAAQASSSPETSQTVHVHESTLPSTHRHTQPQPQPQLQQQGPTNWNNTWTTHNDSSRGPRLKPKGIQAKVKMQGRSSFPEQDWHYSESPLLAQRGTSFFPLRSVGKDECSQFRCSTAYQDSRPHRPAPFQEQWHSPNNSATSNPYHSRNSPPTVIPVSPSISTSCANDFGPCALHLPPSMFSSLQQPNLPESFSLRSQAAPFAPSISSIRSQPQSCFQQANTVPLQPLQSWGIPQRLQGYAVPTAPWKPCTPSPSSAPSTSLFGGKANLSKAVPSTYRPGSIEEYLLISEGVPVNIARVWAQHCGQDLGVLGRLGDETLARIGLTQADISRLEGIAASIREAAAANENSKNVNRITIGSNTQAPSRNCVSPDNYDEPAFKISDMGARELHQPKIPIFRSEESLERDMYDIAQQMSTSILDCDDSMH